MERQLELTSAQSDRVDEIYYAVYEMLLIMLEKTPEELEWDMSLIGPIADDVAEMCERNGQHVRFPAIVWDENGQEHYEE